jgi:fucose permease
MLATLFFVYVGTENALGAWLASYAKRVSDAPAPSWMLVPSYFYGALLLGRALAPIAARYLTDSRQACFGVLVALLGSALLLFSRSAAAVSTCAFLAGLGLSSLYPLAISLLTASFGPAAKRIGGFMFALSTIGGATLPWLVGFLSTEVHSLRAGLLIPFAGCVLMLGIFSRRGWEKVTDSICANSQPVAQGSSAH